ncbi:MFS transporter [Marinimicrobium sp. ARAG 43.8]|uniref:MFS transporter n=1 Tax=Marinimicrobium sp. ARAG 43.8 TaxID=3418719 RepID=UPI003CF0BCF3
MSTATLDANGINRKKLFAGACMALLPTAFSFALVSNILIQLKTEFILTNSDVGYIGGAALWGMALSLLFLGPFLEKFGLKVAATGAFIFHLLGVTLFLAGAPLAGDPSGFWVLFAGAIGMGIGNGLIEVTGNPLTATLFPDNKTTKLNHFHAFFPGGMVLGGLLGWGMVQIGSIGSFQISHWTIQIAIIYIPIFLYGYMLLSEKFPKTELAEAGVSMGEMFKYTFTHPLVLLLIFIKMVTVSLELGPMRWIPAVLESAGLHGMLVFVWITGLMAVLRLFAGPIVERLAPTGMLFCASILTALGLLMFSTFESGTFKLMFAATVFAFGVAFFFPTMVGVMSERFPRAGSLGIVLMIGAGMSASGYLQGLMGGIADRHLPEAMDQQRVVQVMEQVEQRYPGYIADAEAVSDNPQALADLGYRAADAQNVLNHNETALDYYRNEGELSGPLTGNALRSIVDGGLPQETELASEAGAIVGPADNYGGRMAFRWVMPIALIVALFFAAMYLYDRKRGGYRAVKLDDGTPGTGGA